jgi:hypothetical protein
MSAQQLGLGFLLVVFGAACGDAGAPLGPSEDLATDLLPSMEEPLDVAGRDGSAALPDPNHVAEPPRTEADGGAPNAEGDTSQVDDASVAELPLEPVPDPFEEKPVCTSENYWSGGTSEVMHPGVPCIACHSTTGWGRAPQFQLAGTLYPTAHEPDDCNAENPPGAHLEITGADGRVLRLEPNEVGNFFTLEEVALPYTARVVYQGRSRAMLTPQSVGDCNACHTQEGAGGAPGRILLP